MFIDGQLQYSYCTVFWQDVHVFRATDTVSYWYLHIFLKSKPKRNFRALKIHCASVASYFRTFAMLLSQTVGNLKKKQPLLGNLKFYVCHGWKHQTSDTGRYNSTKRVRTWNISLASVLASFCNASASDNKSWQSRSKCFVIRMWVYN